MRDIHRMGLCFIARFAIGNRAVGLYVPVFKNRMNPCSRGGYCD